MGGKLGCRKEGREAEEGTWEMGKGQMAREGGRNGRMEGRSEK